MKTLLAVCVALVALAYPLEAQSFGRVQRYAAALDREVQRTARAENGHPYGPWLIYAADLDQDDVADPIAIFTVEGIDGSAVMYVSYMTVLLSSRPRAPMTLGVGGKMNRQPSGITIDDDGVIVLAMDVWTEDDPGCCPSGKGEARFRIENGRLVEIEPTAEAPR